MIKNRLRDIRLTEYKMDSMKEFADLLEINYRQYTDYEKGVVPNPETIFKIANKLNRPIEDIFYLEN